MKNNHLKRGFTPAVVIALMALLLALGGGGAYVARKGLLRRSLQKTDRGIVAVNSFAECVAAGYPVGESYPRQCWTPDGQRFIEEVSQVSPDATADNAGGMTGQAKVFKITGQNFQFSQNEIRVKKGDRVKINFESADGFHDWTVSEFNARTVRVNTGGKASVEFVADKIGEFEYYCGVGQHRQMGMKGKLIVK